MISQYLFHLFLKLYAHRITNAAYTGILGRTPDKSGLTSYVREIAARGDLAVMLGDLTRSKKAWERNFYQHPDELVNFAFQGLLDRAPDQPTLNDYADRLLETKDLPNLLATIAQSQEHWEKQIGQKSEELVRTAFQGLLARAPDDAALGLYARQLSDTKDVAELLSTISQSQEHWKEMLGQNAINIVESVSYGLGYHRPQPNAMSKHAADLRKNRNLATLVLEMSNSDDYFKSQLKLQAPKLVQAIYQGLLHRNADQKGIDFYSEQISKVNDIGIVIAKICKSSEYRINVNSDLQNDKENLSQRAISVDHIERIYKRHKQCSISNEELASHIVRQETVAQVLRQILSTTSSTNLSPRVLLFGAFGNGNMGDVYQAMAVRAHIKKNWGLADDSIFSCSLLNIAPYPFPPENILPPESILNYELINSFDCLVVGGGGLLTHPHDPLSDAEWARRINIPIVLLSVAASSSKMDGHARLLENSLIVSGRDSESLKALRSRRVDSKLIPDPILSVDNIQSLTEFDTPSKLLPPNIDILWILKYPSNDFDVQTLQWISRHISKDLARKHVIVAIEPMLDTPLDAYFPDTNILYFYSLSELSAYIEKSNFVFSMRFHGVIFSVMQSRPTFGFSQIKIKALFDESGLSGEYLEGISDFERVLENLDDVVEVREENLHLCKAQFEKEFSGIKLNFSGVCANALMTRVKATVKLTTGCVIHGKVDSSPNE
jgi:hypothetical protein